jgi:hypothetical protein
MRHRFISLPLATLASLVLASAALAGGWAEVTVTDTPTDPSAGGGGTPIELRVLQHGVTPVSWPSLTVIATDAASHTVVHTKASAKGPEGTYVATIDFPIAGDWTLTYESAELDMVGSSAISVAPAAPITPVAPDVVPQPAVQLPVVGEQPAAQAGVTSTANGAVLDIAPLALVIGAGLVAMLFAVLMYRRGALPAGRRVSVRT